MDSIQSGVLRLALGALHTFSNLSLCAEAGVPPLQLRFLSLTTNFLAYTTQFPQNPIFLPSLCPQNSLRLSLEANLGKHLRLEPLPPIYSSFLLGHSLYQLSDSTWLPSPDLPTQRTTSTSKLSSLMNFPPIPSVTQMDPNQEPK